MEFVPVSRWSETEILNTNLAGGTAAGHLHDLRQRVGAAVHQHGWTVSHE